LSLPHTKRNSIRLLPILRPSHSWWIAAPALASPPFPTGSSQRSSQAPASLLFFKRSVEGFLPCAVPFPPVNNVVAPSPFSRRPQTPSFPLPRFKGLGRTAISDLKDPQPVESSLRFFLGFFLHLESLLRCCALTFSLRLQLSCKFETTMCVGESVHCPVPLTFLGF